MQELIKPLDDPDTLKRSLTYACMYINLGSDREHDSHANNRLSRFFYRLAEMKALEEPGTECMVLPFERRER